MECFFDIGITNGLILSHWNNKWNVSMTLKLHVEYFFDIEITNGMFILDRNKNGRFL